MWKRLSLLLLGVCLSVSPGIPLAEYDPQEPGHYLNKFLIEVDSEEIAKRVARDNGFHMVHKVSMLDMYLLEHPEVTGRSKRSADDYITKLQQDNRVKFAEQQITLKRVKRSHEIIHDKQLEFPIPEIKDNSKFYRVVEKFDSRDSFGQEFNDRYYRDQWYLDNEGQTGGEEGVDLNVKKAWDNGFDGKGVVVTVLDDGIEHKHPDLRDNYDPEASEDMNDPSDEKHDPTPDNRSGSQNSHGTRCAGEIAAKADNSICGVGVAPRASIGGIRILDGRITDELEARALLYNNQHIHIYSASWGPHDNGATMEGPKKSCSDALKKGVETGRGGKGSIYVWATGNGGQYGDMCGADGYVSSPESISVQSLTDKGDIPFFGESCCSTMISVPTGGEHTEKEEIEGKYKIKVVTTDIDGGCVENFEGTSSAAPLASGCYALLLQANPDLTWRDVQHITAVAARIPHVTDGWTENGAEYHVNSKFGFGIMDCTRMVELAQEWELVPKQHICQTERQVLDREIPSSRCYKYSIEFDGCHDSEADRINSMEHVQLNVQAKSGRRGNVEIFLTSPAGTRSELLSYRPVDDGDEDIDFTFMTVHNWGEDSAGSWEVEVCDNPGPDNKNNDNTIQLNSVQMKVYGFYDNDKEPDKRAKLPSDKDLLKLKSKEFKRSREAVIKRAQGQISRSEQNHDEEDQEYAASVDKIMSEIGKIFDSGSNNIRQYSSSKHFNNRNYLFDRNIGSLDKRGQNVDAADATDELDAEIEDTKREIIEVLREFISIDSEAAKEYLESYFQHRRELERQRKIQELIKEINDVLENDEE